MLGGIGEGNVRSLAEWRTFGEIFNGGKSVGHGVSIFLDLRRLKLI